MSPKFLLGWYLANLNTASLTNMANVCSHISLNRIDAYLSAEELDRSPTVSVENHTCIGLEDATISWNSLESIYDASRASSPSSADDIFALRNVSLDFPTYQLSIICGPTGSGKTLLMLGLLGEAVVMKGKVFCPRSQVSEDTSVDLENLEVSEDNWILEKSIAYVAQNRKQVNCINASDFLS